MTPAEVERWQRGAGRIDYLGQRLVPDGDLGPRTRWAMYLETLAPWRQSAVRAMLTLRGMAELPGNRGTVPDFVSQLCGVPSGSSWCAAGYSWALWVAGLCHTTDFAPDASVARLRASLTPVEPGLALPGDFASWVNPDGTGHGGMVIWPGTDIMASCDANLGNAVELVAYPAVARQYHAALTGWAQPPGPVPDSIRRYHGGHTR